MRERGQWTEQDLLSLIGEPEAFDLEFKRAEALGKDSRKKEEIGKSVASIAHAAGGFLIFGIKSGKNDIAAVVTPVLESDFSKEWLTEVIRSQINPHTLDFDVQRVPLESFGEGNVAYIVSIPQANEPYQASDFKFWRRVGTITKEMTVYEIEDVRRRSVAPDLSVSLAFLGRRNANGTSLEFEDNTTEWSKPLPLDIRIHNRSTQPSQFATVIIHCTNQMNFLVGQKSAMHILSNDEVVELPPNKGRKGKAGVSMWVRDWSVYKGDSPVITSYSPPLDYEPPRIRFNRNILGKEARFYFGFVTHAPLMQPKHERFIFFYDWEELKILPYHEVYPPDPVVG